MAGQQTITAYLIADKAADAIDFYIKAFGAKETGARIAGPDGKIGHAELTIGGDSFYLADEFPDMGARSPKSLGGSPVMFTLQVADVDSAMKQAADAGAEVTRTAEDQFYGERSGHVLDPFGYRWALSQHIEDVPPEELKRRAAALYGET